MKTLTEIENDYINGVYDEINFIRKRDDIEYLLDNELKRKDRMEAYDKSRKCILQDISKALMEEYEFNKQQAAVVSDYILDNIFVMDDDCCIRADEIANLVWNILHC